MNERSKKSRIKSLVVTGLVLLILPAARCCQLWKLDSHESLTRFKERVAIVQIDWTEEQVTAHLGQPNERSRAQTQEWLTYKWQAIDSFGWRMAYGHFYRYSFAVENGKVTRMSDDSGTWGSSFF